VLAALQQACAAVRGRCDGDHTVVLTAPWRGRDPWQLGRGQPRGAWDPRALVGDEPVVVYWGCSALVEAKGPSRFQAIRDAGQHLLSRVLRVGEARGAPPPRLWGGLSFSTDTDQPTRSLGELAEDPWQGFGEARFVLPRWVVGLGEGGAYVQLAASAREVIEHDALSLEIRAVLDSGVGGGACVESGANRDSSSQLAPLGSTEHSAFLGLVERALHEIDRHAIEKVVVARAERHMLTRPLDVARCMRRLATSQPGCVHFAFPGDERVLVGATPEKLVVRRGAEVETEALAGTALRSRDAERDLLASEKDRREHALVVEGITRALRQSGAQVRHLDEPRCRSLAHVVHLCTPIVATGEERHVLDWVADLHPTPAMGGWPRNEAAAFIQAHEPVARGWYASPVGWFDESGDGTFVVAIRSAVVGSRAAWLFAGAGVVAGSDPQRELEETGHKLAAMRGALEVSP